MSSSAIDIQEARARSVRTTDDALEVDLIDGRTIIVPLAWYPRLWHGTPRERDQFELFGDGAYLHWPALDEDLTVAGLLAGQLSGESPESLNKWLASRKAAPRSHVSKRRGASVARKLATNSQFLGIIEKARKEIRAGKTVSLDSIEKKFGLDGQKKRRKKSSKSPSRR